MIQGGDRNQGGNWQERYLANTKLLGDADIHLASFPRSGNTWVRYMLADLFTRLVMGRPAKDLELPQTLARFVPDIYVRDLRLYRRHQGSYTSGAPFYVVKSHELWTPDIRRAVYILRKPEDSLLSYWHFQREWMNPGMEIALDDHVRHFLSAWTHHVQSYLDFAKNHTEDCLILSYETMRQDSVISLSQIVQFMNVSADKAMIEDVARRFEAQNMKALQKVLAKDAESQNQPAFPVFRRAEIGEGHEKISAELLALIETTAMPLYNDLDAIRKKQVILYHGQA